MGPLETKASGKRTSSSCLEDSRRLSSSPLPRRISIMSVCDYDPERRPDLSASHFLLWQMRHGRYVLRLFHFGSSKERTPTSLSSSLCAVPTLSASLTHSDVLASSTAATCRDAGYFGEGGGGGMREKVCGKQ